MPKSVTAGFLRYWAEINQNALIEKVHHLETVVWLSEMFFYPHPNNIVLIDEEEKEFNISNVVIELEDDLNTAKRAYKKAYDAYDNVREVALEGGFTESLQKNALKGAQSFTKHYLSLVKKCEWYKDEIVKRLKDLDASR